MEPFTLEKRRIIVSVFLKGPHNDKQKFRFILDTGASTTVVSEDVAISLGFDLSKVYQIESFVTAGGRVKAKMIRLHKIELFGKAIPNFAVCVIPLPYQVLTYVNGLVGVDFLQQLKKLNIHFDTREIEAV
jgi:clan AA aspartic protease (TIGR02281 family)